MRKIAVIVNPVAGGKSRAWPIIEKKLKEKKLITLFLTQKKAEAIALSAAAIEEGYKWIVAVGGDGTLNEVANGILQKQHEYRVHYEQHEQQHPIYFSYIMMGRGNDFRRNFPRSRYHWSQDLIELCKQIDLWEASRESEMRMEKIDVGLATFSDSNSDSTSDTSIDLINKNEKKIVRRYFLNHTSCGLSADINHRFNRSHLYKRLSGIFAYTLATLQTLVTYKNQKVDIRIDEGEWDKNQKIKLILIGNGKTAGGGMPLAPAANMCDGFFEVIKFGDVGIIRSLFKLIRVLKGTHLVDPLIPEIKYHRAKRVDLLPSQWEDREDKENNSENQVQSAKPKHQTWYVRQSRPSKQSQQVQFEMEGEVVGILPVTIEMIPAALQLIY